MRLSTPFLILLTGLLAADIGLTHSVARSSNPAAITGTRKTSLLKNVVGLPPAPSAAQVSATSLNTDDIQGDILVGMHKQKQLFYFFAINDVAMFKSHLVADLAPIVASVTQLSTLSLQPLVAVNIAFSNSGLQQLNVTEDLGDSKFAQGQAADASSFNEETSAWVPHFAGTSIHGVILLSSDTLDLIAQQVASIEATFGTSILKLHSLAASIRPGSHAGHEMFGYLDGIAQPAINGLNTPLPGQNVVEAGVIIIGAQDDPNLALRPAWAVGGSFLAFRQLEQRVPEFNKYLLDNAPEGSGDLQGRADLLGARMVGRWKSGAPVDLAPTGDDTDLGADPQRNNNFTYAHDGFDLASDQSHCPFSAHIRKTRPRADLPGSAAANSIMRSGLPYGPEVTAEEAASNTTSQERGLAFVAYQSDISKGFRFLQQLWANNVTFPPRKSPKQVGFDPLIGQAQIGQDRFAAGLDPNNATVSLSMPQFIISHGGEYFFTPPISALSGRLAV